jgi:predicted DNA-binding transcriptional regulator AlpA
LSNTHIPRLLGLKQIIGDPEAKPPIIPIIPISKSSWWAGIKSGLYPAPVKIGANTTVWREDDIRKLLENLSAHPLKNKNTDTPI